jgi:YidC/Oxa1 family membrane protein insertase
VHARKAKDGWIAIVQHYFVSAWLPKPGTEREYFTNKVGENLYTAGVVVPVGTIAPAHPARSRCRPTSGPQETEKLEKARAGLNLVGRLWMALHPRRHRSSRSSSGSMAWSGNWGWAIIILTIVIKLVFYPLNAKGRPLDGADEGARAEDGEAEAALRRGSPEVEPGDDGAVSHREDQPARRVPADPVQIPVFIALYWVLLASIELRPRAVARLDPGSLRRPIPTSCCR